MELLNDRQVDNTSFSLDTNCLQISCNWQITNNKQFRDALTLEASPKEFLKTEYEDVVSLETCISVQSSDSNSEPCMIDIKLTNGQKITQIAVVSEAYVLEFFKQFGEYDTTKFAELIDKFEDTSVYFVETTILPYTSEASIKFVKTKNENSVMWIYGIRLYLTEPSTECNNVSPIQFNPEIIQNFLTKLNFNDKGNNATNNIQSCYMNILNSSRNRTNEKEIAQSADEKESNNTDIITYIDKKCQEMETRLMKRIDEMEQRTNAKLDSILNKLQTLQ
ncbi:uncharacterized protein LOC108623922 [Ceratina calcarata]|uniref:Uncharacterized protein LOC108623922 n=1 Tax=Ceratina calcarata TaxID=156304 RepID=A0AAJ7IWJ0_9HYME|nr:uncharacterized protein LOC108623922 [Ceratina calcarata]